MLYILRFLGGLPRNVKLDGDVVPGFSNLHLWTICYKLPLLYTHSCHGKSSALSEISSFVPSGLFLLFSPFQYPISSLTETSSFIPLHLFTPHIFLPPVTMIVCPST